MYTQWRPSLSLSFVCEGNNIRDGGKKKKKKKCLTRTSIITHPGTGPEVRHHAALDLEATLGDLQDVNFSQSCQRQQLWPAVLVQATNPDCIESHFALLCCTQQQFRSFFFFSFFLGNSTYRVTFRAQISRHVNHCIACVYLRTVGAGHSLFFGFLFSSHSHRLWLLALSFFFLSLFILFYGQGAFRRRLRESKKSHIRTAAPLYSRFRV